MTDRDDLRTNWLDRSEWPDHLRRQAELSQAIGNLWLALAQHPIHRRIGFLRREFERRAIEAYARAAKTDREALELLALTPRRKP